MSDTFSQPMDMPGHQPEYLEPKTSVLAIVAFVASLLGFVLCCVPVVGMVGTLGLVLGAIALISISMSDGRKKGTGFAIAAVVLGLIAGAINVAMIIGGNWVFQQYTRYGEVVTAIEAGDLGTVQSYMHSDTRSGVDAQRLSEYGSALDAAWGPSAAPPKGPFEFFARFGEVGSTMSTAQIEVQSEYPPPNWTIMPLPVAFDRGTAVMFIVADQRNQQPAPSQLPAAHNMAITAPDGSLLWLLSTPGGTPAAGPGTPAPPAPADPPAAGGDEGGGGQDGGDEGGEPGDGGGG
ncbi:MAG: DUF4190 domain-containing protein [Planctomycetota bacterium]